MIQKEPVNKEAAGIVPEQIEQLRDLFPQAFTEGKIDFDKLKESLGEEIDSRPERYSFSWAGKRDSIRLLQTPSRATLVPVKKESINFDETNNIFIEGDNLEVLKLLYKSYFGRVKMVCIDPPYNTGNDFVYPDNFVDPLDTYLKLTGQKTSEGNLLTSNPETSGRYHSAWLSMMYPRLFVARQLLRDDGVIFISIDDTEVHNLRMVMNEIFGEENFIANVVWQHSVQPKGYLGKFSVHHNHILCYQRSKQFDLESLERTEEHNKNYSNPDNDPNGDWRPGDVRNSLYRRHLIFDIHTPSGKIIKPPKNGWRWSKDTISKKIKTGEIVFNDNETRIIRKIYLKTVQGRAPETIWFGKDVGTTREAAQELKDLFDNESPFDTPKPSRLVRRMLEIATDSSSDDIVLDFFAGSGTTAHAVLAANRDDEGNRRFIIVQLPEPIDNKEYPTIADISKERVRRLIARMKKEKESKLNLQDGVSEDIGIKVFKLAESNYKPWTGPEKNDPEAYAAQMAAFTDPFVPGWKPENVIWEVAIKEGYGLNSEVIHMKGITDNDIYHVTDTDKGQSFRICLDEGLKPAAIRALALGKNDLFICRDKAMTDELVANLALQCRLKTI